MAHPLRRRCSRGPNTARHLARGLFALGGWLVLASACDLEESTPTEVQIVAPLDETPFRDVDDTNPNVQGLQIVVTVEGGHDGDTVVLERLRGGAPEPVAMALVVNGLAEITNVTLQPGANRLQARNTANGRRSLAITVYYETRCGSISFVEPEPIRDVEALVLGPSADVDGSACGDAFSVRVVAATGLPDGSRVSLLAADTLVASGTTSGGVLVLDPVPLDPVLAKVHGQPFELALRVDDQGCGSIAFPVPVRVDCLGPDKCEIASPREGESLNASRDQDPTTPGLTVDVRVSTSEDAQGQRVRLVVNDDPGRELEVSADSADEPVALFSSVSLPEGAVRIDAFCEDAFGNVTASSQRNVSVDSLGCALEITSPAPNTIAMGTPPDGSADVSFAANVRGGDCKDAYVAVLPTDDCAGLFDTTPEALAVGQTSVSKTLHLSQAGSNVLCLGVLDLDENRSVASVHVTLDPGPP